MDVRNKKEEEGRQRKEERSGARLYQCFVFICFFLFSFIKKPVKSCGNSEKVSLGMKAKLAFSLPVMQELISNRTDKKYFLEPVKPVIWAMMCFG